MTGKNLISVSSCKQIQSTILYLCWHEKDSFTMFNSSALYLRKRRCRTGKTGTTEAQIQSGAFENAVVSEYGFQAFIYCLIYSTPIINNLTYNILITRMKKAHRLLDEIPYLTFSDILICHPQVLRPL